MRLSNDKIKRGILHDEQSVRDAAVSFFSMSSPDDRTVIPMATDAIEAFGYQHAFSDIGVLQPLSQTDATITWLADEFVRIGNPVDPLQWEYVTTLSWLLAAADASLLKRRRKDIAGILFLNADAREAIGQRTKLLSANLEECWEEFERGCETLGDASPNPLGLLGHVYHLLEAISRDPQEFSDDVLSLLSEPLDVPPDLVQAWMQVCVIRAAGQMRLADATAHLVKILQEPNEDWVYEDCVNALAKIGGDDVVKAVWNTCAVAPAYFHQYAAWVLESTDSDLSVEAALQLFQQADDLAIKIDYGHALLSGFAVDGIAPVRQLVLNNVDNEEFDDLRYQLTAVCTLMEAEFPEMPAWREEFRTAEEEQVPTPGVDFPVIDTWSAQVMGSSPPKQTKPQQPLSIQFPKASRFRGVSRNQLCPCKSGKKYKNCCLRR